VWSSRPTSFELAGRQWRWTRKQLPVTGQAGWQILSGKLARTMRWEGDKQPTDRTGPDRIGCAILVPSSLFIAARHDGMRCVSDVCLLTPVSRILVIARIHKTVGFLEAYEGQGVLESQYLCSIITGLVTLCIVMSRNATLLE
jgi:hypothetical protein